MQFTEAQGKVLDAFQQRGLRKIMGIPPTFIDRSTTNEEVCKLANAARGCDDDKTKATIIPFTETIKQRKTSLLGHIIRAGERDSRDPMYQVTFEGTNLKPRTTAYRRVGKPRHKWHTDTLASAWQYMEQQKGTNTKYNGDHDQRIGIKRAAIDREKPFHRTKNEIRMQKR